MTLRLRLSSLVDDPAAPPAILLCAPAGYGKSTVLQHCGAHLQGRGTTVRLINGRDADGGGDAVEAALKALSGGPPAWLLIDDLHLLPPSAQTGLERLIDRPPSNIRLLAASRVTPNFGVARLVANGRLLEFDVDDLRLTDEEAEHLLVQHDAVMDVASRRTLLNLAQGWPAALKLAVGALKPAGLTSADMMAQMLRPGSLLERYLNQEVLAVYEPQVQQFLMEIGALGPFCAEFAEHVTGRPQAEAICLTLARDGVLTSIEAEPGHWRRCHPLVAAFLEAKLRREQPERSRRIHLGAAAWHEERAGLLAAIPHAFAAQDADRAARLLARASDARERIGRWRTFNSWVAKLPPSALDRYPEIRIEAAAAHGVLLEFDAAYAQADAARKLIDQLSPQARDELVTAEAVTASFADRPEAAMEAGERGLRLGGDRDPRDPYVLGTLHTAVAVGWMGRGAAAQARQQALKSQAIHQGGGRRFGEAVALALIGETHAMEGELSQAVEAWRRAQEVIRPLATAQAVAAMAGGYMAEVLYERNDLAGAQACLDQCLSVAAEIVLPSMIASMYVTASRMAVVGRDFDKAAYLLDELQVTGIRRRLSRLTLVACWERTRIALQRGWTAEARRLADHALGLDCPPGAPDALITEGGGLAALAVEAAAAPGRALLSQLRAETAKAKAQNQVWRMVRLLIIEAQARASLGDRAGALRGLRRALELAAPRRMMRGFLDAGGDLIPLLRETYGEERRVASGLDAVFLQNLLQAAGEPIDPGDPPCVEHQAEPLSKRELEVLNMLAAGLSNQELADRLFVSMNTVKWHLQHVFAKLGVKSRTRAVAVARSRRLVT